MKNKITDKLLNELIKNYSDRIKGVIADKEDISNYDKKVLVRGIEVELEHTNDLNIALEIAADHLKEDINYYKKLDSLNL